MGFYGDGLLRKFDAAPPPEWIEAVGMLKDSEITRGLRRIMFGAGAKGVPSLPEFVRICRLIGDDAPDEGPSQLVALPSVDAGKYDYWDAKANSRFLRYVGHRLIDHPRAWGKGGSRQQADATRIAVGYKKAWAQDMRDADQVDAGSGEIVRLAEAEQDRLWADCMKRAEADIAMFLMEKAA